MTLLSRGGRTVEGLAEALLTEVVGVPVGSEGGGSYGEGQARRARVLMEVRWVISR